MIFNSEIKKKIHTNKTTKKNSFHYKYLTKNANMLSSCIYIKNKNTLTLCIIDFEYKTKIKCCII